MSDPKNPKPSQPAYLPRTWKAEPEPVEEPSPLASSKTSKAKGDRDGDEQNQTPPLKKKKKKQPDNSAKESTGSKLEETPLLDTYETRQKIRYAVGGVMTLVAVILIMVLVKAFQPATPQEDPRNEKKEGRVVVDSRQSAEREAAALLENARQADKIGRGAAAVDLLRRITRHYDGTDAGKIALAALDRERRNRPLFAVEDPKNPTGPTTPTKPAAPQPINPGNVGLVASTGVAGGPTGPTPPTGPSIATSPSKPPEIVVRPLPNGFRPDQTAPVNPTGWPTRIICDRDQATMILIPGGEFLMGRDDGGSSERPSHRVKLSAYYIDEHEVTNRQYQVYLKETGRPADLAPKESVAKEATIPPDRLDYPVTGLTAREARAYCYWANRRLPTEAQWEMAARSADGRVAYGPNSVSPADISPTNRPMASVMTTSTDRSPFGPFDLAGNAWEWTGDYYDSKYYYQLRDLTVDPTGPTQSRIKPAEVTVKGGSKAGILTWRDGVRIDAKYAYLGFRGALPVELPITQPPTARPGQPGVNPPGGTIPF